MDTANMTRKSDDANSSDDLIAELAKLMADEARGEPDANSPPQKLETKELETPAQPVAETPVPPLKRPIGMPTPTTSPSDRLDASGGSDALYDNEERFGARATPRFSPTFKQPASRANPLRETIAKEHENPEEQEDRFDPGFNAPVFETKPPQASPVPVQESNQPSGADAVFDENTLGEISSFTPPDDFSTDTHGYSEPVVDQFQNAGIAPAQQQPEENKDPIGDLISAQLVDERVQEDQTPVDFPTSGQNEPVHDRNRESDNFTVSPVFGLGTDASPPQHEEITRPNDPLEDIESLIGDAVRVGMNSSPTPEPSFTRREPPVSSTSSGGNNEVTGAAAAAEAAILAATASMNTSIEPQAAALSRVNRAEAAPIVTDEVVHTSPQPEPDFDTDQFEDGIEAPQRSLFKQVIAPVAAGALLLVIGVGAYMFFVMGTPPEGEAPVLIADTEPVKAEPEVGAETPSDASQSVVFNELDGNSVTGTEQLVSRDQSATVTDSEVSRVITTNDDAESGLANRRVRTVTVRPDGTIVSGDEALAGNEILPVDRPDVPQLPQGTEVATSEFSGDPIIPQIDTPTDVASIGSLVEDAAAGTLADAGAPIPRPRPTNRTSTPSAPAVIATDLISNSTNNDAVDLIANTASQALATANSTPISATPAAGTTTTAPVVSSGNAASYVQLSSQRDEAAALQSLENIRARFGNLLAGGPLEVQRADLGERGIFYRVRMPADSAQIANTVCEDVKLNGGDCFVRSGNN